eukprot:m51a1_g10149 hypothetical protein (102) ;mRNA; f:91492-91970
MSKREHWAAAGVTPHGGAGVAAGVLGLVLSLCWSACADPATEAAVLCDVYTAWSLQRLWADPCGWAAPCAANLSGVTNFTAIGLNGTLRDSIGTLASLEIL